MNTHMDTHPPSTDYADFYVAGGTLRGDTRSYIERKADTELFERVIAGDFCYVLTTRQMGKSSLMARTAARLNLQGVRTVMVDLNAVGGHKDIDPDQWFCGVADEVIKQLNINMDLGRWWQTRRHLPPVKRLMDFFIEVVMASSTANEPVAVFIDEIDTTLDLPFTDDFFAAIRSCYNARAAQPQYRLLTFVLLGVASPSDLIKDPQRTPFNIGTRIELTDFTLEEAAPLALGLSSDPGQGQVLLKRVLYWTGGHPYLTQKICKLASQGDPGDPPPNHFQEEPPAGQNPFIKGFRHLRKFFINKCFAGSRGGFTKEPLAVGAKDAIGIIDRVVERYFIAPGASNSEDNIQFVVKRMTGNKKRMRPLLRLYRRLCTGKPVEDNPLSPIHTQLKLSGAVAAFQSRVLAVRNRVYREVFTPQWVTEVMPVDWKRNIAAAAVLILMVSTAVWFWGVFPRQYIEVIQSAQNDVPAEAYEKLKKIPFYGGKADELLADYWDRQALNEEFSGDKDFSILYRLHALSVKDTPDRRRVTGNLTDTLYKNLKMTLRHDDSVRAASFSPDGTYVATGSGDILNKKGTAQVWEWKTGKPVGLPMKHDSGVIAASFSPDGTYVVTGSIDKTARVSDRKTGKPVGPPLKHNGWVQAASFSPDGTYVVTGSVGYKEGTAQVWDWKTGKPVGPSMKHNNEVTAASFSPDGKYVVTGSYGTAQVWEWKTGKPVGPPMKHNRSVNSASFSPDGQYILTGGLFTAQVWEWKTGKPVGPPMKHGDIVFAAAFSPDGTYVAIGSYKTAQVWEWKTGKPVGPPLKHNEWVQTAAFSPDGTYVATGSYDRTAQVWEWKTGKPVGPPLKHDDIVTAAAFSPDGKYVVTGSGDNTARVWEWKTGKPVGPPLKHGRAVYAAAFSPDGTYVVTGSRDNTAKVWDWETGKPVGSPLKHNGWVLAASFSPDGKSIITATSFWIYRSEFSKNGMTPVAARPLPYLNYIASGFRFLDPSGETLQVALKYTADTIVLSTINFNTPPVPAIKGTPAELMNEWQFKLGLVLDAKTGEIKRR